MVFELTELQLQKDDLNHARLGKETDLQILEFRQISKISINHPIKSTHSYYIGFRDEHNTYMLKQNRRTSICI